MAAPAVTATPLRKSRRVMLRFIPSSRSVWSLIFCLSLSLSLSLSGAPNLGIGLLDGQFCTLESDAAVGSVAEWFVHRTATAAQRKRGLAGEIVRGAINGD